MKRIVASALILSILSSSAAICYGMNADEDMDDFSSWGNVTDAPMAMAERQRKEEEERQRKEEEKEEKEVTTCVNSMFNDQKLWESAEIEKCQRENRKFFISFASVIGALLFAEVFVSVVIGKCCSWICCGKTKRMQTGCT